MSVSLSISAISGSGPKATAVMFVKSPEGVRPWAWVPNAVAAGLVPGMVLTVESVSTGKVETTFERNGQVETLKVPRQQLFLGGSIVIDAPDSEPLPEATFTVSDAAAAYREAYLAKRATPAIPGAEEEPI